MKLINYAFLSAIGLSLAFVVRWSISPEPTPQHTTTVSGSSGDLICTSSCTLKPQ